MKTITILSALFASCLLFTTGVHAQGAGNNTPTPLGACDMGGENGWDAWKAAKGTYGIGTSLPSFAAAAPPASPRFNLTNGTGIDPCTPGINAGDPPISVVVPGFGNASIQIGNPMNAGALAEQLTYPLTVTAQDTNFTYAYAIVMNTASGHSPADQPFVSIGIYDQTGATIPGGYYTYFAQTGLPGFYTASCFGGIIGGVLYQPWTLVSIDLSPYIGQTLNVVITNVDCRQGGHFAHSYWDFSCLPITTSIAENSASELKISVFPNPFFNKTTFSLNKDVGDASLQIFDLSGKEVMRNIIPSGTRDIIVKREGLSIGMYFYKIVSDLPACPTGEKYISTGKLIIQ